MHYFMYEPILKGEEKPSVLKFLKTGIGGRWVHQYSQLQLTKFYMETLDDFTKDYPKETICDIVDNLDYWTLCLKPTPFVL